MRALAAKNWKTETDEKEKYALYLASREWSVLKESVKKRSGGICERCKLNKSNAVHHLTYARKYMERLDDLQDICNPCHEFTHGKREDDPANTGVDVFGVKVKSVYLAGRISGDAAFWRGLILEDWPERYCFIEGEMSSFGNANAPKVKVPDHTSVLSYSGPFWCLPNMAEFPDFGKYCEPHTRQDIPRLCHSAIRKSDLVFAYIDSQAAYGTFTEIGIARGLNKLVVVCVLSGLDIHDIWFPVSLGNRIIESDGPKDGWVSFWKEVAGKGSQYSVPNRPLRMGRGDK